MTFFGESTYLVGPIKRQKHYTPYISTHFKELNDLKTPFFYPTLNNKIFYSNLIFNTYLINKEEKFCTLYSTDNKLTIIKNVNIEEKILFTVKIAEENEYVRVVNIYKYDSDKCVGYVCNGTVKKKEISTGKNMDFKSVERKKGEGKSVERKKGEGKSVERKKGEGKSGKPKKEEVKSIGNAGTPTGDLKNNTGLLQANNKYKYTVIVNNKEFEFVAIREYQQNESIKIMLVRKDVGKEEKLTFREVDYFESNKTDLFYVQVEKEDEKCYFCKGVFIKGLINKEKLNREIKIGEILRVKVLQENNFKFVFGLENSESVNAIIKSNENTHVMNKCIFYDESVFGKKNTTQEMNTGTFNLKDGMIKDGIIKNIHKTHGTFVIVDGFVGIMKKSETSKEYVNDIERYLIGKRNIKGMVYNVNERERKFMFSVRKYESSVKDCEEGLEMSVPFKRHKKDKTIASQSGGTEEVRSEVVLSEDAKEARNSGALSEDAEEARNSEALSEGSEELRNSGALCEGAENYKNNAMQSSNKSNAMQSKGVEVHKNCLISFFDEKYENLYGEDLKAKLEKLVSYDEKISFIENELQKNKEKEKYEFLCVLLVKLAIIEDENTYNIVKKYHKTNPESFFVETIKTLESLGLENEEAMRNVYKLYFKTFPNKNSFTKLLINNIQNNVEDETIYKNEFKCFAIPILYDKVPNEARVRCEKMIENNYKAWIEYIEIEMKLGNENAMENAIEYIRNLFRRAVEKGFSTSETKNLFKKWLEFEKKNDGDCEEVKNRAKLYVEKINK